MLGEPRQGWFDESAAEREDQTIIPNRLGPAANGNPLPGEIDVLDLAAHLPDADGRENLIEPDAHLGEVRLVIADTDRVPVGPINEKNLYPLCGNPKLATLAGRSDGRPKPGKSAAEDDDPFHLEPIV